MKPCALDRAKEGSCYSGVLKGAIKISLPHLRKQLEPRRKLKSSWMQLLTRPLPPTDKSTYTIDSERSWEGSGRKGSEPSHQPSRLLPSLPKCGRTLSISPHAIIRVRLVVFQPHIIFLGGGSPFFWGLGIRTREHVLGNVGSWRADEGR